MTYGAEAPIYWYGIPQEERDSRAQLSSDQCIIDDQHFFLRGRIKIPVIDGAEPFFWGVWVSLSGKNFARVSELWDTPGREAEPPYFGWLSTELSPYPDTVNLKTFVHTQPVGERPLIELEATDHPLAIEQRQGITMERVRQIAELILHQPRS